MIANSLSPIAQPRNSLLAPVRPAPQNSAPASTQPALLANAIGHAALLSDTPEKWASTIAMLRQNGVDPEGYADFEKGRPAALAAIGIRLPGTD